MYRREDVDKLMPKVVLLANLFQQSATDGHEALFDQVQTGRAQHLSYSMPLVHLDQQRQQELDVFGCQLVVNCGGIFAMIDLDKFNRITSKSENKKQWEKLLFFQLRPFSAATPRK